MKCHAAALFAATLACTGLSQAQTAASASGVINGLGYHLVDLDLTDGVTPWVKFSDIAGSIDGNGYFSVRTWYPNNNEPGPTQKTNSLFNGASGSFGNATGTQAVSVSGSQISSAVTASVSDLNDPNSLTVRALGGVMYYATATFFGNSRDVFSVYDADWQLSPNTKLVIDGTIDLKAAADASLLTGTAAAQLLTSANKGLLLSSSSSVRMSLSTSGDYASYSRTAYATSTLGAPSPGEHIGVPGSLAEGIQLSLSNTSNSALTGRFYYSFESAASLTLTPVIYVPEPGTWALMALGLMGVGAASRRASRA